MINRAKKLIGKAWEHKGLRYYGANSIWLFAEKTVRIVIGLVVGIYVARQLGPGKYGLLSYAVGFVGIFSIIASFGLDPVVVRELVKYPEKRNKLLGSTFVLKLLGFVLMLSGVGIALYFSSKDYSTKLIILVIAAGYLFQIFQTIDFYFQSQVLSKYVAISQIIAWVMVSFARAFCAWQNYPLIYFAWLEAIYMCLVSLGYLFFYVIKVSHPFHWRFDLNIARGLFKYSWPLLLSSAAGVIYMRIDIIMIKEMLGNTDAGYYSVAAKLSEIWYFFPLVIGNTLLPAVIRSKKISKVHYMKRLQKYYTFMIWTAILLCVGMNLISYHLVTILYGKEYAPAVIPLIFYMWYLVVMCAMIPFGNWLMAENMQSYAIVYTGCGAIINVILNYILIQKIGINGAAIATVVGPFVSFLIIGFLNNKTRRQLFMALKGLLLVDLFKLIFCKQ